MELYRLADRPAARWQEILRHPSLSVGLYKIPAGSPDTQSPHGEDEVYHVISGRARFREGDRIEAVGPGTVIFVAKRVPHRFEDVTEDLTALVFFAPAEGTAAASTNV